jgi:hypothetical protein
MQFIICLIAADASSGTMRAMSAVVSDLPCARTAA